MNRSYDIAVIGGGVIGICTAHFLAERGRRVVVLEQGEVCSGSSHGNAGLIVPSHSVPLAAPGVISAAMRWMLDADSPFYIKPRLDPSLWTWVLRFRAACNAEHVRRSMPVLRDMHLRSLELFEQFAGHPDMEFGFGKRGRLLLFRSEEALEEGIAEARLTEQAGIRWEALDAEAIRQREPNIRMDVMGGVFYPQDADIVPDRFVRGLASRLEGLGVEVRTSTAVHGFELDGRRLSAARTSDGPVCADEYVIAAGSWSPALGRELRLKLPIQPAKGYSITVRRPEECPETPMMLTGAKIAMTPMADALRFAGTLEMTGMDLSINQRRVDAMLRAIPDYFPGLDPGRFEVLETWCGLRPCSPDGLPFLGRTPRYDNLTIAAGHAMVGISTGPFSGQLAAEVALGDPPSMDLTPLAVDRYE